MHFETRFLGIAINPALMFNFPMQDVVADTYTFHSTGPNRYAGTEEAESNADVVRYIVVKHDIIFIKVCFDSITPKLQKIDLTAF